MVPFEKPAFQAKKISTKTLLVPFEFNTSSPFYTKIKVSKNYQEYENTMEVANKKKNIAVIFFTMQKVAYSKSSNKIKCCFATCIAKPGATRNQFAVGVALDRFLFSSQDYGSFCSLAPTFYIPALYILNSDRGDQ